MVTSSVNTNSAGCNKNSLKTRCLGEWNTHGSNTGGFYSCNVYKEISQRTDFKETEAIRETIAKEVKRYHFYFERTIVQRKMQEMIKNKALKIKAEIEGLSNSYVIIFVIVVTFTTGFGFSV